MLQEGIIELVEKSEWISPIFIQEKRERGIRLCVGLINLNDAYIIDSFPTPFTDEAFKSVGEHKVYSFTNNVLGYHQIKIEK